MDKNVSKARQVQKPNSHLRDPKHKSRKAAIRLIEGAVKGVKKRK